MFHTNPTKRLLDNMHLVNTNGEKHNEKCKIISKACSDKMSDVPDLCEWHRLRMATHHKFNCNCKMNDVCNGDALGRRFFRDYYNMPNMSVVDMGGYLYCCGSCQNTDSETHMCGDMYVGSCCINEHPNAVPISNLKTDFAEEYDIGEYDISF